MTKWQDLAACAQLAPSLEIPPEEWSESDDDNKRTQRSIWYYFYEGYEQDHEIPYLVDSICTGCLVKKQCLDFGVTGAETGVFGGVYLNRGKIDEVKNEHKTTEVWKALGFDE